MGTTFEKPKWTKKMADASSAYSLVEIVSDPGDGTPLHVHQNEDEHIFVLEGPRASRSATRYSTRKQERW
jgi:mannose-6-phosphate isomerase-like protein (cupin superfamily)